MSGVKQKECLPGPALVRTQAGTDLSPLPSLFPSVSCLSWRGRRCTLWAITERLCWSSSSKPDPRGRALPESARRVTHTRRNLGILALHVELWESRAGGEITPGAGAPWLQT